MFVIITYDVGEKRVGKVCKKLREYLDWTQNSVFEGEITEGKLQECLFSLKKLLKPSEDSLYLYKVSNPRNISKSVIGVDRIKSDLFL